MKQCCSFHYKTGTDYVLKKRSLKSKCDCSFETFINLEKMLKSNISSPVKSEMKRSPPKLQKKKKVSKPEIEISETN